MKNTRTPYGCTICKKKFSNPIYLVKHVDWRHPPENNTQSLLSMFIKDLVSSSGYCKLCQLCDKHVKIGTSEKDNKNEDRSNLSNLENDNTKYFSKYPLQNFRPVLKIRKVSAKKIKYWTQIKQCFKSNATNVEAIGNISNNQEENDSSYINPKKPAMVITERERFYNVVDDDTPNIVF